MTTASATTPAVADKEPVRQQSPSLQPGQTHFTGRDDAQSGQGRSSKVTPVMKPAVTPNQAPPKDVKAIKPRS